MFSYTFVFADDNVSDCPKTYLQIIPVFMFFLPTWNSITPIVVTCDVLDTLSLCCPLVNFFVFLNLVVFNTLKNLYMLTLKLRK